ncbi:MAG TPA: beta-1,6-N-acetylglucosaminyltransferase [Devosia sp.]|nr:beta-1,6-N-acetylglucosaminyltransferase [Devosia sp.]
MTVAFLILAHSNAGQLRRLVDRLSGPGAATFVHLDRKAERAPFVDALASSTALLLPEQESLRTFWGGASLVRATLKMLQLALADPDVDRLCLLSGACYPARPLASILASLEPSGQQHLYIAHRFSPGSTTGIDRFYAYRHRSDSRLFNHRTGIKPLRVAFSLVSNLVPRTYLPDFPIYHGSTWWALDRRAAEYVIDFAGRRPDILRWFDGAMLVEEAFFGSVLRNSPFASEIVCDYVAGVPLGANPNRHGVHYVDWSQSTDASPKVLTIDDLEPVIRSDALFVRKVDPQLSASLMDALDGQG